MATGRGAKKQARGPAGVQMHGAPIQTRSGSTNNSTAMVTQPTTVKKVAKRGNRS
jgi:hypothetical protein